MELDKLELVSDEELLRLLEETEEIEEDVDDTEELEVDWVEVIDELEELFDELRVTEDEEELEDVLEFEDVTEECAPARQAFRASRFACSSLCMSSCHFLWASRSACVFGLCVWCHSW